MPTALTIVLLQPAQDLEDPAVWNFNKGFFLLWFQGKLLPGPKSAYGQFHLLGLSGNFLQLLLVIAGEVAGTQLSRCLP